jgi:hypothetical protein
VSGFGLRWMVMRVLPAHQASVEDRR